MLLTLLLPAYAGSLHGLPSLVGPGEDQPITHLIPAGDLNGDGVPDLVATVPNDDTAGHESGAIYVVLDMASVAPLTPLADQAVRISGDQTQGYAGYSAAVLGDTDGDGLPELAVSAPEADGEDPAGGRVYVVSGAEIAPGSLGEHAVMLGAGAWTRAGTRLFAPGDLDDDGRADLLVGAPYPTPDGDPDIGWLALVLAPDDGLWSPVLRVDYQGTSGSRLAGVAAAWVYPEAGSLVGRAAALVPDEDGDGREELLVGAAGSGGHQHIAPPDAGSGGSTAHSVGSALLFEVPNPVELRTPRIYIDTDAMGTISGARQEALPWELLTLADGRVVMSATEGNAVYLFDGLSGRALSTDAEVALTGDDGAMLGWAVAGIAGLDGTATLAISEPGFDGGRGRVFFLDGDQSGVAAQLAGRTLEGCYADGLTGSGLDLGPGASGELVLGITAPEASVFAEGDGLAVLLSSTLVEQTGEECPPVDAPPADLDGDGYGEEDCDDAVPWRHPDAVEVCGDGADDDCDGEVDEACGPADTGSCAHAPGGGLALALLALLVLRRRAVLLLLPGAALAADFPVDGAPLAKVYGSAEWERLHGPAASGTLNGVATLFIANYQGTNGQHSTGELTPVPYAELLGDVDLAGRSPTFSGHEEHDYFGTDFVLVDGALVVGADNSGLTERDAGNVAVFLRPGAAAGFVDMEEAELLLEGDDNADAFGREVEAADLNADGVPDLALAAPMRDDRDDRVGSVWILDGPLEDYAGAQRIDRVASSLDGSSANAWFGWRLRASTDLNGDGHADLIIGELGSGPTFGGRLWVMAGGPDGPSTTLGAWEAPTAGDRVGTGLAVGDLDADGVDEVLVGSPIYGRGAGRVWLLSGAPAGIDNLDAAALAMRDGIPGENLGASVAMGPALLVGAPRSGRTYALDASLLGLATLTGDGGFGSYVTWIDDLDLDGHMDVFVTSPERSETREGQCIGWVISGKTWIEGGLPTSSGLDADADGVSAPLDCDDGDPRRSPEALEVCNDGLDNDCDWVPDEDDCVRNTCAHVSAGPWLAGLLALAWRRRRAGLLALALAAGCKAPPLELSVPASPLSGEVPLSLSGNYDQLILEVDGVVLAGGPGPALALDWDTTQVEDGTHTVTGKGLIGRDEPIETFVTVEVDQLAGDTTAPTLAFVNPVDGDTLPSGVLTDGATVELSISDAGGLASVALYADGALVGALPTVAPFELLWTPAAAGEHTLQAEAADLAGNTATTRVAVTVEDGSGMECTLTSPRAGATVSGTVEIRAAISSPNGVSTADFFADGQLIGTDAESPWAVDWDASAVEGAVTLTLHATDRAGLECEVEVEVTVSSGSGDPFEVVITSPQDGGTIFGASVPVRVAAGGGGGPASVELYAGEDLVSTDATAPFEFSLDSTALANGSVELRAVGEERGTGALAEDRITVTVNN